MKEREPFSMTLRRVMHRVLTSEQRAALRRSRERVMRQLGGFGAPLVSRDLPALAMLYGSDKWGGHRYAKHYEHHFKPFRKRQVKVLEIGIGGYDDPNSGGASLRMWKAFFPLGEVYGVDIYDKGPHQEERIQTFKGDQTDERFLRDLIAEIGRPDIIIDDGSHMNEHVIATFRILYPLLADNGIYAIEDTQTAYWPDFGGSDSPTAETSMNFLKSLVDCLNWEERIHPGYEPSYFDERIVAMHFYHNLVMIEKGRNNEGSSILKNNTYPEMT